MATTTLTIAEQLILDESLDLLDPLRHLREDDNAVLVPVQPPSIRNQDIQLSFPSSQASTSPLTVCLNVDASPGCGGIAWPAGEVSSPFIHPVRSHNSNSPPQVLATYVSRRGSLQGKRILELGSGTGLVGLAAGLLGADVWITDQAFVCYVIQAPQP